MMRFFSKKNENILKEIYKQDLIVRYALFLTGVFLAAISFNLFILPMRITFGFSGIAVVLNQAFGFNAGNVLLLSSIFALGLSYFFLGKDKTKYSIAGAILYPIFIRLTENVPDMVNMNLEDPLLIVLYGSVITGFGIGLVFKTGFTTGGTDILNQIAYKYAKISIGTAMIIINGAIILIGMYSFGLHIAMYSLMALYIISVLTDKVILGISNSKMFYIVTSKEKEVKDFIIKNLHQGVTMMDSKGGFSGHKQKVIMCTVPTKQYFILKEGINQIDEDAFFVVSDTYETFGGSLKGVY